MINAVVDATMGKTLTSAGKRKGVVIVMFWVFVRSIFCCACRSLWTRLATISWVPDRRVTTNILINSRAGSGESLMIEKVLPQVQTLT
jgi:hypothetical protein